MALKVTVEDVRRSYKDAPVEVRPELANVTAAGVALEFDYHQRTRLVVPADVDSYFIEGYVQTDLGDRSGRYDDNDAPYKLFVRHKMKNIKVLVAS